MGKLTLMIRRSNSRSEREAEHGLELPDTILTPHAAYIGAPNAAADERRRFRVVERGQ